MAEMVIGFGGGKRKDLRDWATKKDESAAEEAPPVDLGEKRLLYLCEKAVSGDAEALLKAIKEVAKSCMGEGPAKDDTDIAETEG